MDTNETTKAVAEAVREHIAIAGETQLSIAEVTGIPRTTLMRRLSGVTPFTVAELAAIASALGCTLGDLIVHEDAA